MKSGLVITRKAASTPALIPHSIAPVETVLRFELNEAERQSNHLNDSCENNTEICFASYCSAIFGY